MGSPIRSVRPMEDEAPPGMRNLATWNWLARQPDEPEACEAGGADDAARALLATPREDELGLHHRGAASPTGARGLGGGAPRRRGCPQFGGISAAGGLALLLAAACLAVRGTIGPAAPPGLLAGAGGLAAAPREFEAPTPTTTRLLAAGYSTTHGKHASAGVGANEAWCERCPVGECDTAGGAVCPVFDPPENGYHCKVESCDEVPTGESFSGCWEWEGRPFYTFRDADAPCLEAGSRNKSAPSHAAASKGAAKAEKGNKTDKKNALNAPHKNVTTAEKEAKKQAQKRSLLAMKEKELGQALGNALNEALRMEKESPNELADGQKNEQRPTTAPGARAPKRGLGQKVGRGVAKASTARPTASVQASTTAELITPEEASTTVVPTTSEQAAAPAESTAPEEASTTATVESAASEQASTTVKPTTAKETFDLFAPPPSTTSEQASTDAKSTATEQASTTAKSTTPEQASTTAKSTTPEQASTAESTTSEQASTTADSTTTEQASAAADSTTSEEAATTTRTSAAKRAATTTTTRTSAAKRALSAPPGTTHAATTPAPTEPVDESDVRLTSYWDVFDCGPAGDDHNSDWCGGNTHAPECRSVVDTDVCASGKARLKSQRGRDGDNNFFQDNCLFVFFAQYVCEAPTTTSTVTKTTTTSTTITTTVTGTLTNTSTTTTSATNTTTVTTTTTVLTTTAAWEGKLLKAAKELEASLLEGDQWSADAMLPDDCDSQWKPPDAPEWATDHNGIHLPDVCFRSKGPHRVFVIGDWGGVLGDEGPEPANQRSEESFVYGVDDSAQVRVARQMAARANITNPDYVLNAGDNFYWGGLEVACGINAWNVVPLPQFEWNFEKIYEGPGLTGKPWLGVLGNHDYGGFAFMKGWDQLIAYTWGPGGRWVMPAQYYRSVVRYPGFSVDYFFMDTNANNAAGTGEDVHNICSSVHNPPDASCGEEGPKNIDDCPGWFSRLWEEQQEWVDKGLAESTADWQVIVTHYPPTWEQEFWVDLSRRHGVDLFVTGHIHSQNLHHLEDGNFLSPTAWVVSGGGGGITSEATPDPEGNDDQYGFYELTLSKEVIQIQGFSHGGFKRSETFLKQRLPERKKTRSGASHGIGKKSVVKKARSVSSKAAPAEHNKSHNLSQAELLKRSVLEYSKTLKKKL